MYKNQSWLTSAERETKLLKRSVFVKWVKQWGAFLATCEKREREREREREEKKRKREGKEKKREKSVGGIKITWACCSCSCSCCCCYCFSRVQIPLSLSLSLSLMISFFFFIFLFVTSWASLQQRQQYSSFHCRAELVMADDKVFSVVFTLKFTF